LQRILKKQLSDEFQELKVLFDGIKLAYFRKEEYFKEISMGMSADYKLAIAQGSTMVRIGSGIFGKRVIKHLSANGN
jgi:uncharacterized pyridoxal phosphate-containing UPF0001 family protein